MCLFIIRMVTLLPSQATRNISVTMADVSTSLTISAPSSVQVGASFTISGILIRNDTGGPVSNASIVLSYNGSPLGSASTGVDGDYLRTVNIPTSGSFTLKASFSGMSVFGASEASTNISIGGLIPSTTLLFPFIAGISLLFISQRLGPIDYYRKIKKWFKK